MGMPREIRDNIYRLLFVKKGTILVRFSKAMYTGGDSPMWNCDNSNPAMKVGPKHITSILRANKQTKEEGTDILYGENLFESYHIRAFDTVFVKYPRYGIGQVNAGKIKSARFGVPLGTLIWSPKEDSTDSELVLGFLCDILCATLKGLQHLTLKTKIIRAKPTTLERGKMVKDSQKVNIRALLVSAARATKFHPCLRKAIWRRWSGGYIAKGRWIDYTESVEVEDLVGEFFVDLVVEGLAPALDGRTVTKKDAYARNFKSKDMVINSQLVRRTAWLDPEGWLDVHRFGLSKDVSSSEVDPSQVERWLGAKQHNLDAELDPESVAATERYLARFETRVHLTGW
ncbi:hypothetical protein LTR10_021938 [Elasticomyces elasticus]|uniref:Uncharacterized protein n=1 Tax=Exophiala sideris TaxID=1016849 RepID=A0ABR0JEF2_9EURO|nr:hypothetical protein LTR10_021938 [Elasticomyces elasticus]KAK5032798.1 hypothetical protein LTS07_004208 [Exophiala sideris]KAK5037021.1 hypothetical protein LTR13_004826 [Exophiala sideris]KAK5062322.1 hypothetical protein LTR69_004680 [Exophiala sideris]KAK5182179.1 hypothetical protein LTR44_005190 [Eurotiomycetes sp. CCFEE 6388]